MDWSTLDVPSTGKVDYSGLNEHNLGAYANVALGEKLPSVHDAFPMTWTPEEMGRIVRRMVGSRKDGR